MRILFYCVLIAGSLFCNQKEERVKKDPNIPALAKDFRSWWSYYNSRTLLSADFIPLGTNLAEISKNRFFDSLVTGKYIPVKAFTSDSLLYYYLYPLSEENTLELKNIRATIGNVSYTEYENFKMEGKPLRDYNFTDLNGRSYNKENTKNNWLIIKCWFINCVPCVEEMPALNEMVEKHQSKKDILFISLAFDKTEDLKKFLTTHEFNYAVVPNQQSWLTDTLRATQYPTHIIVNKQGQVVKVVNTEKELKTALSKHIVP